MRDEGQLIRWGERALRLLAALNWAFGAVAVVFVVATLAGEGALAAQLVRKYGAGAPVATMIWQLRALGLLALVAVWPIDRCLRPLARLIASVRTGAPFAPGNAALVATIGWALLALQLLDLAGVLLTALIARTGAEVMAWQPSLIGWITVPVAFVLARVFAAGAALDADLEGTV